MSYKRFLFCGDRKWANKQVIRSVVATLPEGSTVIEGEARGVDTLSRDAALERGLMVERYPAQWSRYGRRAGPIRNQIMLEHGKPEVMIYFHYNIAESKGTKDMITRCRKARIPVYSHREWLEFYKSVEWWTGDKGL